MNQPKKPLQQRRVKSSTPANVFNRNGKKESIMMQVLRVEENNRKLEARATTKKKEVVKVKNNDIMIMGFND